MKIKIGNWKVDTSSLIRVRWEKFYPKLILHERFEKHVKWILRILTSIGVISAFFVLPYWIGITITFLLLGLEQIFERVLFEYSVMVVQPFPDFKVEYEKWLTNGYLLIRQDVKNSEGYLNYFGPVFSDKNYAVKFFRYISSWNFNREKDEDNNICISFILEDEQNYTSFLYSNPNRNWLDPIFSNYEDEMKFEKYGKQQQSLVAQMIFWKKLTIGGSFQRFITQQKKR